MVTESLSIIEQSLKLSKNPVVACSWGKDSTVLLHLVQQLKPDIEIIYCYQPKMPLKNMHAVKMAAEHNITMHIYPPSKTTYIQKDDGFFDVLHFYYVNGKDYICLYNGCVLYKENKPFFCALDDLINIPTVPSYLFKWDCIFQGSKDADNHFENRKIKSPIFTFGNGIMSLPLHDWADEEILQYLKDNNVSYQKERYADNPAGRETGTDRDDANPDVFPTCHDCFDNHMVFCPKKKIYVEYQGRTPKEHKILEDYLAKSMNYMEAI